ncbi:cupin domain-containing protein [Nitratifractor sp.]
MASRTRSTGLIDELQIVDQLEAEGYFNIFRWSDPAGTRYAEHTHPHDEVRWILSGTLVIEEGGEIFELRAGDRMESPAGIPHSAYTPEDCSYICASRDPSASKRS